MERERGGWRGERGGGERRLQRREVGERGGWKGVIGGEERRLERGRGAGSGGEREGWAAAEEGEGAAEVVEEGGEDKTESGEAVARQWRGSGDVGGVDLRGGAAGAAGGSLDREGEGERWGREEIKWLERGRVKS
ncbi:hypothetical protein Scep_002613 [Stephania cephalantha]|uniref:Uncharacterized protein n=1 Tax=Stephania cephalantha TaxID=152367 RepID=A0AAP0Q4G6_9MAGN